jgi:hypothetical protein
LVFTVDIQVKINVAHAGSENKPLAHVKHAVWLSEQSKLSTIFNSWNMQDILVTKAQDPHSMDLDLIPQQFIKHML